MKKYSRLFLFIVCVVMLSGCSLAEAFKPTPTLEPTPTTTPSPTPTPTETPTPTLTPSPMPTATPTPLSTDQILARNYVATQQIGLVEVEIIRLLIGEKDVVLKDHPDLEGETIRPRRLNASSFMQKDVVGELVLRITNKHTERKVDIYLAETNIGVSGQQISLVDFIMDAAVFGDNINPFNLELFPETTVLIGYWFAFEDMLDGAAGSKLLVIIENTA